MDYRDELMYERNYQEREKVLQRLYLYCICVCISIDDICIVYFMREIICTGKDAAKMIFVLKKGKCS